MAVRYMDTNGTSPGYGTLTSTYNNLYTTSGRPMVGNNLGTSVTTANLVTTDTLSFGSASVANTTPGTLTIVTGITRQQNGLETINLGNGTQTLAGTDTTSLFSFVAGSVSPPYVDVGVNSNLLISASITGATAWEKRGINKLTLTNTNTFSAGMTITAGTVEIGNASALGSGTVTMTGGKLSSSSTTGYTLANALTLNGTMTLGDATNTGVLTFNGALSLTGNTILTVSSSSVFAGAGTSAAAYNLSAALSSGVGLYFQGGAGTFTGGIATFSGGTAYISNFNNGTPNQLVGFSTLTFNSDALILGNTAHTFANIIGGTGTVYVRNTSASGITFNGSMASYAGSLRAYADSAEGANPVQKVTLTRADQFNFGSFWFQSGGGLTTLSQTLTYTGSAPVTQGAPIFLNPLSAAVTAVYENNSSNNSAITVTNVLQHLTSVNGTFRIAAINGNVNFTQALQQTSTGILSLSKTGSNAATLSGSNTFTGSVAVSEGTLNANSATALGLATSTAGISVTSGATLSLGAAATYASRSLTIGGTGVSSTVGALVIANTGTSQFQSITLGSPTNYIRATNNGSINSPFTPNNNSVIFGASAGSNFIPFASLSNVFSGLGSVTYGGHSLDTGIVRADVRHIYTGNTTLAFGTTYVDSTKELAGTGGPLGNKTLTAAGTLLMTGGTLSYLGGNVDYSGRLSTAGGQQWKIDAAGQTVTFATALLGASALSMFDTGTGGSLTLSSASSTFSGGVTITSGTLYAGAAQTGVSGPLGITGTITFSPAGTGVLGYTASSAAFDYSSRFATTSGQTRRINANGESVTFLTAMGGTNAFALVGSAGILTLAVANTYSQGTTLSVGVLKCGNVTSLGTGALAQANNTTLHVTATGGKLTIQGAHTNTGTGSRTIRIGA